MTLKMAVLAPMPSAMMRMATWAKPGLFRNSLSANFKFCMIAGIFRPSIQRGKEQLPHHFFEAGTSVKSVRGWNCGDEWCPLSRTDVRYWTAIRLCQGWRRDEEALFVVVPLFCIADAW